MIGRGIVTKLSYIFYIEPLLLSLIGVKIKTSRRDVRILFWNLVSWEDF